MTSATALMPTAPRVSQHAETPRELVAKTRSWIDCQRGRHDVDRLEFLSGLLACRDGVAASALLDQPTDRAGGVFPQVPCYMLASVVCGEFERRGLQLADRDLLLRIIRHQVRAELVRMPSDVNGLWLVPARAADRTEAHVATLLLMRKGVVSRPWLWGGLPQSGRFKIIGSSAGMHPAVDHQRCDGPIDIRQIASRTGAACA